jgi:CheY-like chemotaxis protein
VYNERRYETIPTEPHIIKDCCKSGSPMNAYCEKPHVPAAGRDAGSTMSGSVRKNILLVEDDAIMAFVESQVISLHGYRVISAVSGEKAIDLIKTDPSIDLVLMDIDLGYGIDGTEVARTILTLRHIPLLFLSSHSERAMRERVCGITHYGYVRKDSIDTVLLSCIERAFERFETSQGTISV